LKMAFTVLTPFRPISVAADVPPTEVAI